MFYLVVEHYYNGEEYEDAVSSDTIRQAFDTVEKCKAYIRHERKKVKQGARRYNEKIRVTTDQFGVHCAITKKWHCEYFDWTIEKIIVH